MINMKNTTEKIAALRKIMQEKGLDVYLFSGSDAHQSEYVTGYWQTREWISGFTGSNGFVAVTADDAGLWTDGRYFVQAEQQLAGSPIKLFKSGEKDVPTYGKWLAEKFGETLKNGEKSQKSQKIKIGFDGRTFSLATFDGLKKDLAKLDVEYLYNEDIINDLWTERPPLPVAPVFVHDLKYTGKTSAEKLAELRIKMQEKSEVKSKDNPKQAIYLTAALDEIAWLANIRGNDIQNTPVVFAYLLVDETNAWLFVDEKKLDEQVKSHLSNFTICAYDEIFGYIQQKAADKMLIYSANSTNVRLFDAIPKSATATKTFSIIADLKTIKNATEISNTRQAFLKEGVALVQLHKWLSELDFSAVEINEIDVQNKMSELRLAQAECLGDSFTTIAAYGENAAFPHYSPTKENCAKLKNEGFLLVDTGGQYLCGTTDVTRTIALGSLTDEMRRDFTLVLKGHIALASVKFLQGVSGVNLDILARQALWAAEMNYNHGTGHGIGYCLGVHESPPGIAPRPGNPIKELLPGMICSNEPGLYKPGKHGIRTENDLLIIEVATNEFGTFLAFETLSFCPIDTAAIDKALLTDIEVDFLNGYHAEVFEKLSPLLTQEERDWLAKATEKI